MMSVHDALKDLLPCDFDSVPQDERELAHYIRDAVRSAQILVESVPPAPSESSQDQSRTISAASSGDQVMQSSASSDAPVDHEMRKAWGKPMKLSAKDNPHRMAVYKMAAKDRRGAWFARHSVHEGLGFARWKKGLITEFNDSLRMHGKPGDGNVRGIGGEKVVVEKEAPGAGSIQVFHLTAQFPGPSAPRDFVELLISSTNNPTNQDAPRQYLLVSKPVKHADVPEQNGYVRGEYESIEFIREIPVRKTKMMSTSSLPARFTKSSSITDEDKKGKSLESLPVGDQLLNAKSGQISAEDAEATLEARKAHKDASPSAIEREDANEDIDTDSGVAMAVDENDDLAPNPVEWVMITRSDPGGSVPRFMVERGTPSAIVSDAGKFLQWATQKAVPLDSDREAEDEGANEEDDQLSSRAGDGDGTASSVAETAAQHTHGLARTRTVASTSTSSSSSDSFVSADSIAPPNRAQTGFNKYDQQEHELGRKLEIRRAKAELQLEDVRERHPDNESRLKRAEDKRYRKLEEAQKWHDKEMLKVRQRREKAEKKERESGSKKELRERIERLIKENEELKKRITELEVVT